MSETKENTIIGIDLAGVSKNPTGWVLWKNKTVSACHLYNNNEIIKSSTTQQPNLIAIDAPLSLPTKGVMRKADLQMHENGYPVLPPRFPAMEKLILRAIEISQKIIKDGFEIIEVHPTSTRKALKMPTKDWNKVQEVFLSMGLEGDIKKPRPFTPRTRRDHRRTHSIPSLK
jgi:predicted nuclease with RNAse H fold